MKQHSQFLMVTLALATASVSANAQLATFDDLSSCTPSNDFGILIPNGYAGFDWTNFYVGDGPNAATATGGPGYANGVVTPRCFAANGFGAQAIVSSTAFTFNGGYFTAAFVNGLTLQITGFNGTTPLFSQSMTLNTSGPQLLDVVWDGLTSVSFESGNVNGNQFVFDNFRFNNTVDPTITPEPASMTLLATGLIGLYGGTRRRRIARPDAEG